MTHAPASLLAPEPRMLVAELVAQTELTPRVRSLRLNAKGTEPFDWIPGQYVEIGARGSKLQPYSIASAPDASRPGSFELAVSTGEADRGLGQLLRGVELDVRGPLGQFFTRPSESPKLYVGMGTGLAPLRAMVEATLVQSSAQPLVVLHGAKSEAEILWRSEWEALAAKGPRLRFVPTLTRASESWDGRRGRVQAHLSELLALLVEPEVYVCGLAVAVRDCRRILLDELGVPVERVRVEGH